MPIVLLPIFIFGTVAFSLTIYASIKRCCIPNNQQPQHINYERRVYPVYTGINIAIQTPNNFNIDEIPVSSDIIDNNSECCICLSQYSKSDTISILECGHFYHTDCIKKWYCKSTSCPICRFQLPEVN